jgi:hypothetical protein
MTTIVQFRMGDVLQLRKPHPCGSSVWTVVRLGADIGLLCSGCGRRVLLPRSTVERRMKKFVERGPEILEPQQQGAEGTERIT